MVIYISETSMLRNPNNIYLLKLNCVSLTNNAEKKCFKYATEIGTDMSAEDQMVTKTPFSAVLKTFPILLSVVYRKYLLNKYMVTIYGCHEYLHFKLKA